MPEMIPLGWFHLFVGVVALVAGGYTLARHKEIRLDRRSGMVYLVATLITAGTALGIFQHGKFGPGHALAILTLGALLVGTVAAKTSLFGGWSRYIQAVSYSATLLFHCIPAITDFLLRLPADDPFLSSIEDPILKKAYGVLLLLYLIGVGLQIRWIRRQ